MLLEERYVDFICEHGLTQGQFLLLYLLYKKRSDLIVKYKKFNPGDDPMDKTMIGRYWVTDLINRGFVNSFTVEDKKVYEVSIKFRQIFCSPIEVAEELVDAYPSTMEIDGKIIPLTALDTIVVATTYNKAILDSHEEHLEVLKDIQYGKENNMISMGLKSFIHSKFWLAIRKKRKLFVNDTGETKQTQSFG